MDDYHTVINMQTTTPSKPVNMPVFFAADFNQLLPSADDDAKTPPPSGNVLRMIQHDRRLPAKSISASELIDLIKDQVYDLVRGKDTSQIESYLQQILSQISQVRTAGDLCPIQPHDSAGKSPLENNTILHILAGFGNDKLVEFLIDRAPYLVRMKNFNGDNPLHVAARAGHFKILEKLFQGYFLLLKKTQEEVFDHTKGFLWKKNKQGNTILHEALIHKQDQVEIINLFDRIIIPDSGEQKLSMFLFEGAPQVTNNDGKSALYLAIEMGFHKIVEWILENYSSREENEGDIPQGKSPLHAAIMNPGRQGMLKIMLEKKKDWIHLEDEEGRIALHWAAFAGNLDAIRRLLYECGTCSVQPDANGFYAIHLASEGGHVEVLEELLKQNPEELVNNKGRNILHIAAAMGKLNVVKYILQKPELVKMINHMDEDGNTPLHLATLHNRSKVVYALTWDKRVKCHKMNFQNQTALDVNEVKAEKEGQSLRQRLVGTALKSAGVTRSPLTRKKGEETPEEEVKPEKNSESKKNPETEFKDRIDVLILVSTLIITASFTGGFTLPGSNSDNNQGFPSMINRAIFHLYIYCITISMYGAISVTMVLIWARLGDMNLLPLAIRIARPLLGFTIGTLSLAFLCGVYLVISPVGWLASSFLVIAVICSITVMSLYALLWLPSPSTNPILKYMSYYPFLAIAYVAEDVADFGQTALGFMWDFKVVVGKNQSS